MKEQAPFYSMPFQISLAWDNPFKRVPFHSELCMQSLARKTHYAKRATHGMQSPACKAHRAKLTMRSAARTIQRWRFSAQVYAIEVSQELSTQ